MRRQLLERYFSEGEFHVASIVFNCQKTLTIMISESGDEIDLVESLEDGADAWETILDGTRKKCLAANFTSSQAKTFKKEV